MAWPTGSRYATFIDASTPYVSAAFLNALQDAIIPTRGERDVVHESWAYESSVALVQPNAVSPCGRWKGDGNGAAPNAITNGTSVGGAVSLSCVPDASANPGYSGVRGGALWTPHADFKQIIEGTAAVHTAPSGTCNLFWGFGGLTSFQTDPPVSHLAAFTRDSATGKWECISRDGTAEQSTVTATALPTADTGAGAAYHWLRIELTTSSVVFKLNDVTVATHSTRVPSSALMPWLSTIAYTGGAIQMRFGPVKIWKERV